MPADTVPYLKLWRAGAYQPRWEPGPKLRGAGLTGRALKDEAGQWLQPDAARAEAIRLNEEAQRRLAEGKRAPRGPRRHPRSLEALWETYKERSPRWKKLSDRTRSDYEHKAGIILAEMGAEPVAAIAKEHLYNWWEELCTTRGHAMANGILAVARLLLSYGVLKGWRRDNPALKLEMTGLEPRVVVWLPVECRVMVETADALGLHGVGDAFVIALHTAQRLGDVLELSVEKVEASRTRFLQNKTNARVTVPLTDQLRARLQEIQQRRAAGTVVDLGRSRRVVLRPDGRDYDPSSFNKDFRRVRAAAVAGLAEMEIETDAAGKEFRDLRDTSITRLAEAECTIQEIAAISGHSLQTIHTVMRHYLALSEQMAERGIERLQTWMSEQGIAV